MENKHGILEFGKSVEIFLVAAKLNDISTATEKKTVSHQRLSLKHIE